MIYVVNPMCTHPTICIKIFFLSIFSPVHLFQTFCLLENNWIERQNDNNHMRPNYFSHLVAL
jgi:hypothetical protein